MYKPRDNIISQTGVIYIAMAPHISPTDFWESQENALLIEYTQLSNFTLQ